MSSLSAQQRAELRRLAEMFVANGKCEGSLCYARPLALALQEALDALEAAEGEMARRLRQAERELEDAYQRLNSRMVKHTGELARLNQDRDAAILRARSAEKRLRKAEKERDKLRDIIERAKGWTRERRKFSPVNRLLQELESILAEAKPSEEER